MRVPNIVVTVIGALGASLAAYLGWLKVLDLPCVTSGCNAVLNSSYGTLLGLPTGYLGLIFWAALFLPLRLPRRMAALLLCVGSMGFMYIQFLVLQDFCVFCTAHAVLAVSAAILVWRAARPLAGALVLPLMLPLPLLAIQRHQNAEQQRAVPLQVRSAPVASPAAPAAKPVSAAPAPQPASAPTVVTQTRTLPSRSSILPAAFPPEYALQWLGSAADDKSTPLLVISLTCHHCIDTLLASLRHPQLGRAHGPKILLSAAAPNFELHQYILAATLLYPDPSDGFVAVFSQLTPMRDMIISNNMGTLKPYLLARFPRLTETLSTAKRILVEQERLLLPLNVVATPTFIQPNGIMQYRVEPSDILFL